MSPAAPPSRVIRSRQAAQGNYDRLARWYAWLASSEEPFRRAAVDLLHAQPAETVLEIGCGSGTSLAALAECGVRPVGIDLSYGMLRETRREIRKRLEKGPAAVPLLCQGDGLHLPFPRACFDALLMTFTLELFDTPEIPRVLAGCRRVLRNGGRISIAALVSPARPSAPARIYEWFHAHFPALVDCRPIPLEAMLEQAGFTIEEKSAASMWGLPVACILARN